MRAFLVRMRSEADEDVLELVARGAAAEVGVVLVGVDRRARRALHLAHAGVVVDELRRALRTARRARRLWAHVGAGETVLLVVQVVALGAGAGSERPDLVAVGVVGDGEPADGDRPVGMRRSRRRVAVGVVVGDLRIDRGVLHRGLGLVRDVVDGVVRLAEVVGEGRRR